MPTLADYLKLVTSEHSDKPKFVATLSATAGPTAAGYAALQAVARAFDVDTAVGTQLDAIGEWVGRSRFIATPLTNVYFTWGGPAVLGWQGGSWKNPLDPASGLTTLPDDAYRMLLKAKIAANRWDGSIPGAYDVWQQAFGTNSQIIIRDNQDMTMSVGIIGEPLSAVSRALLVGGYIPLKPEGVRIDYFQVAVDNGPVFAWGVDTGLLRGWGTGQWTYDIPVT